VKVYSATKSHDVSLHQVHDKDAGRIRYQRKCEICGETVAYENIQKAYDDGDRTVVLTDEDFDALPAERTREIEVLEFVPPEQVDVLRMDRSYFLEPEQASLKPYALLRRALEETDRTAIAKFAMRQHTHLAAIRVRDDVLVLQTLLWEDEIRVPDFDVLNGEVKVTAKEAKMASQLVESLSGDFESSDMVDEYQAQLRTLVEAKLEQGDALDTDATFGREGAEEDAEVIDLMEALKRSIDKRKGTQAVDEKKPAKKTTSTNTGKKTTKKSEPKKKTG